MSIRNSMLALAFACALVPLQTAAAAEAEPHEKSCVLGSFRVSQVAALYTNERSGKGTYQRFGGAQVFLPAQPGLTAEWVSSSLAQHGQRADRTLSYDCPLDVPGAMFAVVSGGTGFWVQISAKDPAAAKEILARAKRLVQ